MGIGKLGEHHDQPKDFRGTIFSDKSVWSDLQPCFKKLFGMPITCVSLYPAVIKDGKGVWEVEWENHTKNLITPLFAQEKNFGFISNWAHFWSMGLAGRGIGYQDTIIYKWLIFASAIFHWLSQCCLRPSHHETHVWQSTQGRKRFKERTFFAPFITEWIVQRRLRRKLGMNRLPNNLVIIWGFPKMEVPPNHSKVGH